MAPVSDLDLVGLHDLGHGPFEIGPVDVVAVVPDSEHPRFRAYGAMSAPVANSALAASSMAMTIVDVHLLHLYLEDGQPAFVVRYGYLDYPVEPAWSEEGLIQDVRAVGGFDILRRPEG